MNKLLLALIIVLASQISYAQIEFKTENIVAWCIVPFDKERREPTERIKMLNEIGIRNYAYDWRTEHISSFAEEIKLARQNNINIEGISEYN